ncbi:MOSC domain-containing protein [Fulvimarina endophytica]|uniref:MOSC domain-containing protein n=1 Tax=Fulvimarina endophytica TaxID=2293836 RepID=A0A371X4L1_9HYPH|nr:MOSC N-terminal beta barrel domain-containing protein [Fulvimarina endophytica]RFC64147.1 MOSC domain-containing protein [Fulvimarina endophytica]
MQLGSIHVHPVKGGRSVSLEAAELSREGLLGDRRWMLVDADGKFVTQRQMPALARLEAEMTEDGLILVFGETGERFVPFPDGSERLTARIWRDAVDVALADPETQGAIARWFGRDLRLVYQDRVERLADPDFAPDESPVSLADGYPILIATTASLRDLNSRLVYDGLDPVPMSRFRPNLVIDEAEAWREDGWSAIRIGGVVLDLVKPCARCTVTTVDQMDGAFAGEEPLRILRETRMSADRRVPGVLFGWNAVPRGEGRLDVGDRVEVLATHERDIVRG